MTDLRLTTAERIRILRDRAGLSQPQLAAAAECSTATICAVEDGRRPRSETLQAIAAALGVSVGVLLGEVGG